MGLRALSILTLRVALPVALGLGLSSSAQAQSTSTQRILAWGDNQSGQLGDGTTTNRSLAISITDQGALKGKTVVELAGGNQFSLAVCSDGTLASWGQNSSGQLGDGTNTARKIPTAITGLGGLRGKKVTQISAGFQHALALCADGTVASWGWNPYGQLGDGTTTNKNLPVNITGKGVLKGRKVTRVVAGANHNFALCADGTVAAWGFDSSGQLGDGASTATSQLAPVDITSKGALAGKTVTEISAGSEHTLALLSNGGVAAWGSNRYGQLGNNTTIDQNLPIGITTNGFLRGHTVTQIVAAGSHNLALFSNGTLAAWGRNQYGELGDASSSDQDLPVAVGEYGDLRGKIATRLASGVSHCIALCSDGSVVSWGNNAAGQLGDNSLTNRRVPTDITGQGFLRGKTLTFITAGSNHNLAVTTVNEAPTVKILSPTENQQIFLTNFNGDTIRGDATDNVGVAKVRIKLFRTRNGVNQIWNGQAFTTASVTVDAELSGSGTNVTWKMGAKAPPQSALDAGTYQIQVYVSDAQDHTTVSALRTFRLYPPDTEKPKVFISIPQPNSRLLISQLADGAINGDVADNMAISYKDVQVKLYRTRNGVNQIWNGTSFTTKVATVGVETNGYYSENLNYWRLGTKAPPASELDEGEYQLIAYATDASGNTGSARATFTLFESPTTRVLAWGSGEQGQLGYDFRTRTTPIDVSLTGSFLGKEVVKLAAGYSRALALCDDGTLLSWGNNDYGQLGDGTNSYDGVPVNIANKGALRGKTIVQMSVGGPNTLVLCSDGTLVSWGSFPGNGSQQSNLPVNITAQGALKGKTVVQIATGLYHSAVLCSDGTLATWGNSIDGVLGDGTTAVRLIPASITGKGALAGKKVTRIFVGGGSNFALCSDGTLAAWGLNNYGQLGDGTQEQRDLPVNVTGAGVLRGKTISQLDVSFYHSVALCSDGTVATWGVASLLGDYSKTSRTLPGVINTSGDIRGRKVTQISVGFDHTLALCQDGTALGWGSNSFGQTGVVSYEADARAPSIINLSGSLRGKVISQLVAAGSFSLALGTVSPIPTIKIIGLKNNSILSSTSVNADTFNGDASDNVKVTSVRIRLYRTRNGVTQYWNGTSFSTASVTVPAETSSFSTGTEAFVKWKMGDLTPPQNLLDGGEYTIVATANDADGNTDSTSRTFIVATPESVKPTVSISTPTQNQQISISDFASNPSPISGTASDNQRLTGVTVRLVRVRDGVTQYWDGNEFSTPGGALFAELSGTTNATWKVTQDLPTAADLDAGVYTIYAFANDVAGNQQVSAARSFTLTSSTGASGTVSTPTASASAGHS